MYKMPMFEVVIVSVSLDSLEKERAIYAVVLEKPRLKASCSILINPKSLLGALSSLHESDSEFRSCLRLFYFSSCCSFLTVVVQFRIIIIQILIYTIIALQINKTIWSASTFWIIATIGMVNDDIDEEFRDFEVQEMKTYVDV
ncbi:transmembrane protein, putative [Medicago truncatula]|uniref:Transmembrane protein, putative n=1 Tax=Medicago truncatula TaxID=3880 RepID=A0A072V8X4_MEDTR|nr:transmembrane protein, putative [Medicago truncatula]